MENKSVALEIGQRCRRFRNALDLSQQALADIIGTTPQNISKYEKDGIYNIDVIHMLSEALGHDLLSDEAEEEGIVGEIGKEILLLLVSAKDDFAPGSFSCPGYIDIDECYDSNTFFGMTKERITKEIFKLEKIGLCIREQFTDLWGYRQDWLFITSKGVITIKHIQPIEKDILYKVKTYEMVCQGKANIQDMLEGNPIYKIVSNIEETTGFRANFIQYLRNKYDNGPISFTDSDEKELKPYFPGHNCFYDLMYSMALGFTRKDADEIFKGGYSSSDRIGKIRELEKELNINDPVLSDFDSKFSKEVYDIGEHSDNPAFMNEAPISEELGMLYDEELMSFVGDSISPSERFEREKLKHDGINPIDWFSEDDIKEYIQRNILSPDSDEEKAIDMQLREIIKLDSSALDYFVFPYAWEKNGLAGLIRSKFNYQLS